MRELVGDLAVGPCPCGGYGHRELSVHYKGCERLYMTSDVSRMPVEATRLLISAGVPASDLHWVWTATWKQNEAGSLRLMGRPAFEPLLRACGYWYLANKHLMPDAMFVFLRGVLVVHRDEKLLTEIDFDAANVAAGPKHGTLAEFVEWWAARPWVPCLHDQEQIQLRRCAEWLAGNYASLWKWQPKPYDA